MLLRMEAAPALGSDGMRDTVQGDQVRAALGGASRAPLSLRGVACPAPRLARRLPRLARALRGAALASMLACCLGACQPAGANGDGHSLSFRLDPTPTTVGQAQLQLLVVDAAGQPVTGLELEVEATMSHAGMVPTFATLTESRPGTYVGPIEFSMGGDWLLLVGAALPDGKRLERTLQVPGVRSP